MQHLVDGLLAHVMVILIALPIVGGCAVTLVSFWGESMIRRVAITNAALTLVFAAVLAWTFVPANTDGGVSTPQFQIQDQFAWALIDADPVRKSQRASEQMLHVGFAVGVDGFNLWFVVLTVALSAVAVVVSSGSRIERPAVYYSLLLLLEGTLLAAFSARDLLLFCFCLELSIVPTVLLTGWWGAGQRPWRQPAHRVRAGCRSAPCSPSPIPLAGPGRGPTGNRLPNRPPRQDALMP